MSEYFALKADAPVIEGAGIPDRFIGQDSQAGQRAACGLDADSLRERLQNLLKNL